MKRIILLAVTLSLYVVTSAQNQQSIIKAEALKMAKALAAMDLEAYASYSWPALVNDPESKQKIKAAADSADKYRKQFNIKVKSIIIGNPSTVVTHNGVMQAAIPQTIAVEALMGSIETETTLIALSTDGVKWYFVDANLFKNKDNKTKLPELSPKLNIPPQKMPVMKDASGKEIKM
jgi:lipopolysaccharide export system protein LptC